MKKFISYFLIFSTLFTLSFTDDNTNTIHNNIDHKKLEKDEFDTEDKDILTSRKEGKTASSIAWASLGLSFLVAIGVIVAITINKNNH